MAQDRDQWRAPVNMVIKRRKAGTLLISRATTSFSKESGFS
jgi:hypothetical protein